MAVLISKLAVSECKKRFNEEVDCFSFGFGGERFNGWTKLGFFRISYSNGEEFGRRQYYIFNKAHGSFRKRNGQTEVRYWLSHGLLDPLSMIFVFSVIVTFIATMGDVYSDGIVVGVSALVSILICLMTGLVTWVSSIGKENKKRLTEYLHNLFEEEKSHLI